MAMKLDLHPPVEAPATPPAARPAPKPKPETVELSHQLRPWQRAGLFGLPVVLVIAWAVVGLAAFQYKQSGAFLAADPAPAPMLAPAVDGARLYAQNCAQCHGERGDGVGVAPLTPRARNFGEAKFRLASTANGIPCDDDLLYVLRHGIPGSAMPAFGQLAEGELHALIGQVRRLIRAGVVARLRREAEQEGGEVDWAELYTTADRITRPGQPLELPKQFAQATPESLALGRQVFMKNCATCHGPQGRGDGPQVNDLRNADGSPTRPRDLTLGRYKCRGERERLYVRIMLGMPGTPMPACNNLPADDVQHLLNYVLSLSPPASGD